MSVAEVQLVMQFPARAHSIDLLIRVQSPYPLGFSVVDRLRNDRVADKKVPTKKI